MSKTSSQANRKFVRFSRKPAKMGQDYIISIPRLYIRNGIVDPNETYEIYMRKRQDG
ncbi:MAG TPA: hypothetical protein VKM55_01560 [Candidatus Lokiarchaeia archaeon]|nr:hypothetical protein [Candidatus Lokiarchaeia archaeon]